MSPTLSRHPSTDRLRSLAVLGLGLSLSVAGFLITRDALRRRVEAQFHAAARERAELVVRGMSHGIEDVEVLRSYFEASHEVTRSDFATFAGALAGRHPYIQAFQWLPEVTPANRPALEAEARRGHPGFRFHTRSAAGQIQDLPPGRTFFGIHYVTPLKGNEVTLGYAAEGLPTRQETLQKALATGRLAMSGGVRLIQESGNQTGVLVMSPVRGGGGKPQGVVQGVFRLGNLVQRSLEILEPQGVVTRLLETLPEGQVRLLHEEPSRLPAVGSAPAQGLRLEQAFEVAGRQWRLEVLPAAGHFSLATPWRAWAVLLGGTAFSLLLAGYVWTLLASEARIGREVELRTRELAFETESHRRDAVALQESEARFRHLIEVMGEGMWVWIPEAAPPS